MQLHISHLTELGKCGIRYQYKYLEGRREPGRTAPFVGTIAHEAARYALKQKMASQTLPTEEELADLTADDFNARWDGENIELDEEERAKGKVAVRGANLDLAVLLSTLHLRELAPHINPLDVEWPWVLETEYGIELAGTTDVKEEQMGQDMLKDAEPRPFRIIRDLKTRGKRTTQVEVDTSVQLTIYDLAETVITGVKPDLVVLDTIVKPTLKKPAYVSTLKAERTEADYRVLSNRLERAVKVIESGAFTPANQSDWWCSSKFCGFHQDGSCPFIRNPRAFAIGGA